MRITLSIFVFASVCIGCAPITKEVYVDIGRVREARHTPTTPSIAPRELETSVVSLPALAPPEEGREAARYKLQVALGIAQRQFDTMYEQLLAAYRREALAQARVTETALRQLLRDRVEQLRDSVVETVAAVVQRHAEEKAPVLVRLALLAGWPDTGRLAFIRFARTGAVEEKWAEEAEELRALLVSLEGKHSDQIAAVLANSLSSAESESRVVAEQIASLYRRAEESALRRVRERVAATQRDNPSSLLSQQGVRFEGQPSRSVIVPGAKFQAPGVAPQTSAVGDVRGLVAVWARIHGYTLVPKNLGRDATDEFMAWYAK